MVAEIGDIVFYFPGGTDAPNAVGEILPAIVVKVHSPTCVNLKVFTNSPADVLRTSVLFGYEKYQWAYDTSGYMGKEE